MKTEQKNTKKILISLIALVFVIAALFGIYRFTRPAAVQGEKTVTIDVIHKDASQKTFEYQTDLEYLGELLTEEQKHR